MGAHHHGGAAALSGDLRVALVGSPNAGKTTLFNSLTGLRAKTGNYPGVTVAKYEGLCRVEGRDLVVEDLPGTYSLDPISPDEHVVTDVLDPAHHSDTPDALLVLLDATSLRRSLGLLAQVMQRGLPTAVVLSFTDELRRRGGSLDVEALQRALGIDVHVVVGGVEGVGELKAALPQARSWTSPPFPPPTEAAERTAWIESVLRTVRYTTPGSTNAPGASTPCCCTPCSARCCSSP
ncbi:FeoB small GTPase domain-containing protein [Mobilicoccus caccae]|uniref:FeoB-type G domain-containing protein n=1 Tax=Mobilicoccus caccae TaxID=1859295 RepID=A0ABQ6IUY7_9MICO|nr:FeoB small GTPase domain-containing protein [Mobilicoccus caccae]GMA41299.1 hypothetical protein GCM10025883_33440 [Mobilicoccus caccae]